MREDSRLIAIRKENVHAADEAFADLMRETECVLNRNAAVEVEKYKGLSASQLESISVETIKSVCSGTPFSSDNVILVSGQKFPDIIADRYYGIEVKSTKWDHWTSTGSSIVENTRIQDVTNIYMLFGKLGGTPAEFKCRPYQDVLYEIAVTHSPRYLIDMKLEGGQTIFDKMGVPYDELRTSSDSICKVKEYYKKKAKKGKQMPWWITDINEDAPSIGMNLRLWGDLSSSEKSILVAQMFVLFPEVIIGEYGNATLWLASAKGIVCKNIRDPFSAGGKIRFINGTELSKPLPRVIKNLNNKYSLIKEYLSESGNEFLDYISEYNPRLLNGSLFDNWWAQIVSMENSLNPHIDLKKLLESDPILE